MTPGILAGVTAFLIFNYFYIPPYRTLTVYSTTDLITLVILSDCIVDHEPAYRTGA